MIGLFLALALRFPRITLALVAVTAIGMVRAAHAPPYCSDPAHAHEWRCTDGTKMVAPVVESGPVAGDYTPARWALSLLAALGYVTAENVRAIVAWEHAEGGHWENAARYNPLNTTQPEPGSWPINSVGVQAYSSWAAGLWATAATLRNGRYGSVLAALGRGNCAPCVADAVGSSPWGTGRFAI